MAEGQGILESPSYWLLNDDARAFVDACASEVPREEKGPRDFKVDLASAILNRRSLEQALVDGKAFLKTLDPATFLILAEGKETRYAAKLDVIEKKLELLNYLILMSAERAKETKNFSALPEHRAYLERVVHMLVALRDAKRHAKPRVEPMPLQSPSTAGDQDNPMRYFGMLYIAPAVTKAVEDMTLNLNRVENWHNIPASFNDLRLYLVWANALSQCICNMIAESAQVTLTVTRSVLNDLGFVTGSLGFILYFTTFGLAASIVFQNSLDLGLTKKVRDLELSFNERFKAQWDERKFLMLNNAVWGVVNFVCFFWLVGQNVFGFWGNVVTDILFVADLFLVCWEFQEDETAHHARLAFYEQGIDALTLKIATIKRDMLRAMPKDATLEDELDIKKQTLLARMQHERRELRKAKEEVERAWVYRVKKHQIRLMYGGGVIVGFTILCSFFFPPTLIVPFTAMILALSGAVMCFTLGVAYKVLSGDLIVQKETETQGLSQRDYDAALTLFNEVSVALKASPDDNKLQTESKLLYLSLKKSVTTTHEQTQVVDYQKAQVVCDLLTDIILPTLFLLAFVFMPLGVGMPIFAVGLAVLFYANWQVAEMAPESKKPKFFASLDAFGTWLFSGEKQEEKGLEQFDENKYDAFCKAFEKGEKANIILIEQLKLEAPETPSEDSHGNICPE